MAAEEDLDLPTLKYQLSQTQIKAFLHGSGEHTEKELEVLWWRVKTSVTLLTYLKSKARIMAVPDLAHTSCGIKQVNGVGLVDKNGIPLSLWSRNVDTSLFESPDVDRWVGISNQLGPPDEQDGAYIGEMLKSVQIVADVMESLVKRAIKAESETAIEKKKVTLGQEEIKNKAVQIENLSVKLDEMERFALGTSDILNEMHQRVADLVLEISRQRERAAENELELCRVKRDFESLKSFVCSLISVRETDPSSEKEAQTMVRVFESLVEKNKQLESEMMQKEGEVEKLEKENLKLKSQKEVSLRLNTQKEAEVQKLMEENVKLNSLLDKKEAQLLAINEQCKVMALSASNI